MMILNLDMWELNIVTHLKKEEHHEKKQICGRSSVCNFNFKGLICHM